MHALGYMHEQTRPDRDQYVTINTANIISGTEHNFNIFQGSYDTPYDYLSAMHYSKYAFSSNGQPTIVRKDDPNGALGGSDVSTYDINKIKSVYCVA